MTRQKSFKERIRARMDKTGESYTTARRHLIDKAAAEARNRKTPRSISPTRTGDEAVRKSTGRSWEEWFSLLDRWGGKDKRHAEIARWISAEHDVDGWWAQQITVAYEQARGLRAPGQRGDGTYSVSASKTIAVPVNRLFHAFQEGRARRRWLGEFEFSIRTARPDKSITAEWEDGSTRLAIGFYTKGEDKTQVSLAHEKIADAQSADQLKAFWRERLNALKELLES